jgi:cytochrome c peroxidase
MSQSFFFGSLGLLLCVVMSCTTQHSAEPTESLIDVPPGFPEQNIPTDNQPTAERIRLGKMLFYSTELSRTRTVSCASCHDPSRAFTDGRTTSVGVEDRVGTRNAPSLANVGYLPYFMREGGVPTLEMQVLVPVQEHHEFDMNMLDVVERLRQDVELREFSRAAYQRDLDAYVITRAIACFERTLVSGRSRADQQQLTEQEERGRSLFMSARTGCTSCHGGVLYTSHAFTNNGALETYTDVGRYRLTNVESDRFMFKVPSLRNVGITAPYMNNGTIATLREVIDRYNRGGMGHPATDARIVPLGLRDDECNDLEAFLRSLTDEQFINDPRFRP